LEAFLKRGLAVGSVLDPNQTTSLLRADALCRARALTMRIVALRPRSCREVEEYLKRKGVEEDVASQVIDGLKLQGLLDDHAFASYWIENRRAFRPRGEIGLRAELRRKGVASEVIDDALAGGVDEEGLAYEAVRGRFRSWQPMEEHELQRRVLGFLQRRGFSYSASRAAAKRLFEEDRGAGMR